MDDVLAKTNTDAASENDDIRKATTTPNQATADTSVALSVVPVANTSYSSTTVYISGMPMRYCTETVIEKLMSPYGKIVRCTTVRTGTTSQHSNKVFAFCEYAESTSATNAIRALHGRKLGGQNLILRPSFKESNTVTATTAIAASNFDATTTNNPKRQRQQLDSKIEAIKRKLAKYSNN